MAPAAAPAPVKSPETADQTQLDAYLKGRAVVTAEDLEAPFRDTDLFELPNFEGDYIDVPLPKGKSVRRLMNIEDVNNTLKYLWIDEKTSKLHPRFRAGFFLVQRGNQGAANIPDKFFGSGGVIQRGEHYLWFCTRKHWESMRRAEDEPLYGQLGSYHSEDAGGTKWGKGGTGESGRTQQTEIRHNIVDTEDDE